MRYTSAEAAKLLRKLNEEREELLATERQRCVFTVSLDEDLESVRPVYDYGAVRKRLEELERMIRRVKHGISAFNLACKVPGFDMTIDQMLVYIPQLSQAKKRLSAMQSRLPKERQGAMGFRRNAAVIEYEYANYDIEAARADYARISDELARAQTALDVANSTETMELEL